VEPARRRDQVESRDPMPVIVADDRVLLREGLVNVELTGFEPVTPSLRKMPSQRCDQGVCSHSGSLGRGSGTSVARPGETA